MVIIETSVFTRQVQKLLSDKEYRRLQMDLSSRPDMGVIIPGSGRLRKVHWRLHGRGKRGGVRMIYYWTVKQKRLFMLLIYPKNVRDDLSPAQLKMLKQIVKEEYP